MVVNGYLERNEWFYSVLARSCSASFKKTRFIYTNTECLSLEELGLNFWPIIVLLIDNILYSVIFPCRYLRLKVPDAS
jgi:hypothetical protein